MWHEPPPIAHRAPWSLHQFFFNTVCRLTIDCTSTSVLFDSGIFLELFPGCDRLPGKIANRRKCPPSHKCLPLCLLHHITSTFMDSGGKTVNAEMALCSSVLADGFPWRPLYESQAWDVKISEISPLEVSRCVHSVILHDGVVTRQTTQTFPRLRVCTMTLMWLVTSHPCVCVSPRGTCKVDPKCLKTRLFVSILPRNVRTVSLRGCRRQLCVMEDGEDCNPDALKIILPAWFPARISNWHCIARLLGWGMGTSVVQWIPAFSRLLCHSSIMLCNGLPLS